MPSTICGGLWGFSIDNSVSTKKEFSLDKDFNIKVGDLAASVSKHTYDGCSTSLVFADVGLAQILLVPATPTC